MPRPAQPRREPWHHPPEAPGLPRPAWRRWSTRRRRSRPATRSGAAGGAGRRPPDSPPAPRAQSDLIEHGPAVLEQRRHPGIAPARPQGSRGRARESRRRVVTPLPPRGPTARHGHQIDRADPADDHQDRLGQCSPQRGGQRGPPALLVRQHQLPRRPAPGRAGRRPITPRRSADQPGAPQLRHALRAGRRPGRLPAAGAGTHRHQVRGGQPETTPPPGRSHRVDPNRCHGPHPAAPTAPARGSTGGLWTAHGAASTCGQPVSVTGQPG